MPSLPDPRPQPPAGVTGSTAAGWRAAARAPGLVAGLTALLVLLALPLSFALRGTMDTPLVSSALELGQPLWPAELVAACGVGGAALPYALAALFQPAIEMPQPYPGMLAPLAAGGVLYFGVWLFLTGGVVDRLARGRPLAAPAFFAACGAHAPRLFRLALLAAVPYAVLFAATAPATAAGVAAEVGLVLLTAAVSVVVDFARVRLVVEDRRSALGALAAAIRFIRRRWSRVALLAAINGVALAATGALLSAASVGGPSTGAGAAALLLLVVGGRVMARLGVLGAEIAFFQGSLAHAGYVAAPPLRWPDSPAAEAIRNLTEDATRRSP